MALGLGLSSILLLGMAPHGLAQTSNRDGDRSLCPTPALSRLVRHRVAAGETLDTIAQSYGLLTATLIGLNPSAQAGRVAAGQELLIPPYNGIRVNVAPGQTWQQVAQTYNTRADVLFEVNGCVRTVPTAIFVPGVNWFPGCKRPRDQGVARPRSKRHCKAIPSRSGRR